MNDLELNRAVALARGWEVSNDGVWDGNVWLMDIPPLVCTDPGAWGALFTQLMAEKYAPGLNAQFNGELCEAILSTPDGKIFTAIDPLPGRALALAFLASKGISTD